LPDALPISSPPAATLGYRVRLVLSARPWRIRAEGSRERAAAGSAALFVASERALEVRPRREWLATTRRCRILPMRMDLLEERRAMLDESVGVGVVFFARA